MIGALALAALAATAPAQRSSVLHVVDGRIYDGTRALVAGAQPDWSPDGSQLAFARAGFVWTANADGSGARAIATGEDPAWGPDGHRIAFVREGVLYAVTLKGRTQRLAAGIHPAWSEDGRLAYESGGTIFVGAARVTTGANPAWSPDNRTLAFVRGGELFRAAADGSAETQLTAGNGDVAEPAWSPSGTRIAYVSHGAVQVQDPVTGRTATLAQGGSPDWRNVPTARELIPDLDQLTPSNLYVTRNGRRRLLAFRSAVVNRGEGPLWIRGRRRGRTMEATQLVPRSDGTVHAVADAGFLRYDVAPTHSHWHFHPFESYELYRPNDPRIVARDHKQGFCFGDRHRMFGRRAPRFRAGECGLFKPGLRTVAEGTSVGYVDIYPPEFHGQWIDVTGLREGRYVLTHRVNPGFGLRERSYANNAASLLVELRRASVRVLRRCGGSATCP